MKSMLAMSIALIGLVSPTIAEEAQIERGRYLVNLGLCHDCHTPGYFLGKPDMTQYLGGSDVGLSLPTGVFVGRNLTPDKETGLGSWTKEQIITAFAGGKRPDLAVDGHRLARSDDAGAIRRVSRHLGIGLGCVLELVQRFLVGLQPLRPLRRSCRLIPVFLQLGMDRFFVNKIFLYNKLLRNAHEV